MTFWPLRAGHIVTSRFGPRDGGYHTGTDFGFPGGSAGQPVYAVDSGTVIYCGQADGYGGPDPAGWIVVQSPSGTWEYGHIVRAPDIHVGGTVVAGQRIATINPNSGNNGGVAPHLHLSYMPASYDPAAKSDPMPRLAGAADPTGGTMSEPRPDFNEYAKWSNNSQPRGGIPRDVIDLLILHTQEGAGNADSLATYLQGPNGVSYHYTISQDPKDNGVTVCDVVDTDLASWSVLNANNRSINLCFAGSSAAWSREQWMRQSRAIDVAAYLCVKDCLKYDVPAKVMPPGRYGPPGGITDHAYVTKYLGIGTHTDVGPNFPWDYLTQQVEYWRIALTSPAPPAPPIPPKPVPPTPPAPATDRQVLDAINAKLDRLLTKLGA